VVNTARGDVVVDDALIDAVVRGKISGVGLDVYEGEPNFNPRYLTLNNAFLVPHIGSATLDTRNAMGFRALANLDAVFSDEVPADQIT
jgi:lactate dehydrogenase-like 2-hydroxyacid dehydrogenase